MFYRFIYLVTNGRISFFWMLNNIHCVYVYIYHSSLSFYLLMEDCFHILAIASSVAVNIGVHVSFWITVFFEDMPRSGIAYSHIALNMPNLLDLGSYAGSGLVSLWKGWNKISHEHRVARYSKEKRMPRLLEFQINNKYCFGLSMFHTIFGTYTWEIIHCWSEM